MAARINQIKRALVRLGFSQDASVVVTGREGIDTLDEFRILSDQEVENLCRVIRKPGGGEDGNAVALRAKNNLKLACFLLKYKHYTSRTITADQITLDSVRELRAFKAWTTDHEAPKQVEMEFNHKTNWPTTIEAMEEHLKSVLGEEGVPLAYVIRPSVDVDAEANDPATNYTTHQEELTARAPHTMIVAGVTRGTAVFNSDNEAVWEIMATWTRNTDC